MSAPDAQVVVTNPARWWRALTIKQERFVAEYMKDGNATQAAIRCGFKPTSAGTIGSMMLKNDRVAERIEELRAELHMGTNLTVERVKKEIARIAFADIRKLYDEKGQLKKPSELDDDTAAVVAGMEVEELFEGKGEDREQIGYTKKTKLWDKGRALELAAKHLGMVREAPALAIGNLTLIIED